MTFDIVCWPRDAGSGCCARALRTIRGRTGLLAAESALGRRSSGNVLDLVGTPANVKRFGDRGLELRQQVLDSVYRPVGSRRFSLEPGPNRSGDPLARYFLEFVEKFVKGCHSRKLCQLLAEALNEAVDLFDEHLGAGLQFSQSNDVKGVLRRQLPHG